jgi:glycosyltransferase involved in cell wall biosynthesis
MKIYQMLHFPLAGAGTGIYVDALTRSLIKRGDEVKVLCSDHCPPKRSYPVEAVLFSDAKNDTFDLDFDFPVFAGHPLSKGKKFGELNATQRDAYVRAFRSKIENGISVFGPDIVHVHHGWIIASIVAEFDIPYVVSIHGTEYYAFKNFKDYQESALRGLQGAQVIVALTEQERQQAIEAYDLDPDKTVAIASGTDTDVFRPFNVDKAALLKSYSIEDVDRPIVFFAGRLTAQKGVDTLLKAAQIYSQAGERPITLIAGDGDLRGQLEDLARDLELNSVYFLGNREHARMAGLFNIADVAALPSRFEPFGLVAVEALACGTPVIAGDAAGFRQILNHEVGYLMKPGDFKTLAEKVTGFIKDDFKKKMSNKAVAYVRQNYSWDKTVDNIERTYEQILQRQGQES